MSAAAVLRVSNLTVEIDRAPIVDRVSFEIGTGRILAVVGESGCGKSLTALSVLGLLPSAARFAGGSVHLAGQELSGASEAELSSVRGNTASVIFQEPVASLNPLVRVGEQVEEALRLHRGLPAAQARDAAIAMMERVGIPDPARRARQYPFELSGGMCQRIMIAAALICRPSLLIADEPTTALDVTIQAQILELIRELRNEAGTAVMLITHDMGVVADLADEVCVMYGGRIVESASVETLFAAPRHPYTRLLLATIPALDGTRKARLKTIEGIVPAAGAWPEGCRFRTRCPLADARCEETPSLDPTDGAFPATPSHEAPHLVACWHTDRIGDLT